MNSSGKHSAERCNLGGDRVRHRNGVRRGLARQVDQHGGRAVRGHRGVDGLGSGVYVGHVRDAYRSAVGGCLHYQRGEVCSIVRLRSHQRKDQLVVGLVEAG